MNIPLFEKGFYVFDIETMPKYPSFKEMKKKEPQLAEAWVHFVEKKQTGPNPAFDPSKKPEELYLRESLLYPEFSMVACISFANIGMEFEDGSDDPDFAVAKQYFINTYTLANKSISPEGEKELLKYANKVFSKFNYLAGHNIEGFDIPYLCRRMLYSGIKPDRAIDPTGLKPWETSFFDSMKLWSFGSFGKSIALDLLCAGFGIPNPKKDFKGDHVMNLAYEGDWDTIVNYCEEDTATVVRIFHKYLTLDSQEEYTHLNRVQVDVKWF